MSEHIAPLPTVGRAEVCGACGHLRALHLPNACMEVVLHGGGLAWSCPCPTFMALDESEAA